MRSVLKISTSLLFFIILLSSCQEDSLTDVVRLQEEANIEENKLTTDLNEDMEGITTLEKSLYHKSTGGVYVMDNESSGNHILAFSRQRNGHLNGPVRYATGGMGTGGGLGSQGSIITNGPFLFAVNAGSNEISIFFAVGTRMRLLDKVYSEGEMPTSLTLHGKTLYVLNAGGSGNIAGFRLDRRARLSYIEGSKQSLSSSNSAAAQISFNNRGDVLIVTERATNKITSYSVDQHGVAGTGSSFSSAGMTPFGFEFSNRGDLIVSEAAGGAAGASTVSSYNVSRDGGVSLIDGPVATNQTAACWLVVTNNGRYAYTTNTGSASVSGYKVDNGGGLELLNADGVAGMTGAGPLDMDLSRNSSFLYTINVGDNSISIFHVSATDGSLSHIGEVTGLPETSLGLAAQ